MARVALSLFSFPRLVVVATVLVIASTRYDAEAGGVSVLCFSLNGIWLNKALWWKLSAKIMWKGALDHLAWQAT